MSQWKFAQPAAEKAGFVVPSAWVFSPQRRILDMCVAGTALVICLPLFLVIAVAVRCSSTGPVIFRQRRMGRNGQEFTLYKFRSMFVTHSVGSSITVRGDGRITPLGAFLRRCKLDELPQLWNVLTGDLSLVGPRPKLPHHEALWLLARPGITGPATLAFRNEETFLADIPAHQLDQVYQEYVTPVKARIDAKYLQHATFASDCRVLLSTAAACLSLKKSSQRNFGDTLEKWLSVSVLPLSSQLVSSACHSSANDELLAAAGKRKNIVWQASVLLLFIALFMVTYAR